MNKTLSLLVGIIAVFALILSIGNAVGGNQPVQSLERALGGVTNYDSVAASCYQVFATSTATPGKYVASSTSLVNGVSTGIVLFQYGSCS